MKTPVSPFLVAFAPHVVGRKRVGVEIENWYGTA